MFGITITIHHRFSNSVEALIMSIVSDKVAALTAACNSALARSQAEVTALQAQIASLQAQITTDGTNAATPDDLAAIDSAIGVVNTIDPTNPATVSTPVTPPAS